MYTVTGDEQYNGASDRNIDTRCPCLDFPYPGLKKLAERPSPRLMMSHLPYHLLPADIHAGKGKVIYIARNVKDVFVSYYHFSRLMGRAADAMDFNKCYSNFIAGAAGLRNNGPWLEHVSKFWEHRDDSNILFLTYEQLHRDTRGVLRKTAEFMGHSSLTDAQLDDILHATSFSEMKNNKFSNKNWHIDEAERSNDSNNNNGEKEKASNGTGHPEGEFMRKGQVGDWQNHLTTEMSNELDRVCLQPLRNLQLYFD
jgi:hypothetical protein